MRKIVRKILNTDFSGNVLSARAEQLTDDEAGTIEETCVTAVSRCEACGRPLEKTNEIRGVCISCGASCCSGCEGFCAICGRGPFCGHCKTGFAAKGLSVCLNCLPALRERLAHQDQFFEEKAAFERTIALCTAQLRLIHLLQYNRGRVSRTLVRVAQLRIARKLARLERQLKQENNHGKRFLP